MIVIIILIIKPDYPQKVHLITLLIGEIKKYLIWSCHIHEKSNTSSSFSHNSSLEINLLQSSREIAWVSSSSLLFLKLADVFPV